MKFVLLEPLRGLAALWVLLFHFQFSDTFQQSFPTLHGICKLGELAVPMFFVISGYCIAASARSAIRKNEPELSYLGRRLRRIFPPYWASIAVVVALPFLIEGLAALKSGHFQSPSAEHLYHGFLKYDLAEWFEVVTLTRAFVDVPGADKLHFKFTTINAVYWSLAIEVQFYVLATLGVRLRQRFYPAMVAITALSIPFVLYQPSDLWGVCLPYWPMFALGVGLYALFEQGCAPSRLWGSSAVRVSMSGLLALTAVAVAAYGCGWQVAHTSFAVFFAIALFFVEGFDAAFRRAMSDWVRGRALATLLRYVARASVGLGTMSYSIYLLHGRVQVLAMQLVRQAVPTGTIAFDLLSLGMTVALCYPFFRYCERPWIASPAVRPTATTQPAVALAAAPLS